MVDAVSFNTLIKAHLQLGHYARARALIQDITMEGLQPTKVTFNELIKAVTTKGNARGCPTIWSIVAEMQEADVELSRVTCSILLTCLNASSGMQNITRTMEPVDASERPVDEMSLSSIVEACVRIGKLELLSAWLGMLKDSSSVVVNGAHTFGSFIKAYGYAQDAKGAWCCWQEMRSRQIRPTGITADCMVEAVVSNGGTEGGYELIYQMQDGDQCREALNSVIYCSVLKIAAQLVKAARGEQLWVHRLRPPRSSRL